MTQIKYVRNVPDFKDGAGNWVRSYSENNVKYTTRAGALWLNMNTRCKPSYAEKAPTYEGTTNGFQGFQEFAEWCQRQQGYNEKDAGRYWQLDKDLLSPGNKMYCPDFCMFVPSDVNTAFTDPQDNGLKLGVALYHYDTSRFVATCRRKDKKGYIGVFNSEDEAHAAWLTEKRAHIEELKLKYQEYPKIVEGLTNKMAEIC